MRAIQMKVREFHERYGYPSPDQPELVTAEVAEARSNLIQEELREYEEACAAGDLVKIADAIGDLAYVVVGTGVVHGIDLQPILDEIHRSNMTKDPAADNPLKPVKGPRFEEPRLAALLLIQSLGMIPAEEKPEYPNTRMGRLQAAADAGFDTHEDYRGER